MSLSAFKSVLAASNPWYRTLALRQLEKIETLRSKKWVYEEIKRNQPDIHAHLILSETSESLEREESALITYTLFGSAMTFYSYTIDAYPVSSLFALSSGLAFYGSFLSSSTGRLVNSVRTSCMENRLYEK